jgi:hypothetical protein
MTYPCTVIYTTTNGREMVHTVHTASQYAHFVSLLVLKGWAHRIA